jgi:hypothetical protein
MDRIIMLLIVTIIAPPLVYAYIAVLVLSFKFGLKLFFKIINIINGGNKNGKTR